MGMTTDTPPSGTYEVIAETELAASAASISLTSIPQTYRHLLLVTSLRHTAGTGAAPNQLRINNDTGANYDEIGIQFNGASSVHLETIAGTAIDGVFGCRGASTADKFGTSRILIPDYADTAKDKNVHIDSFAPTTEATGGLVARTTTGVWRSTAAVTRLDLISVTLSFDVGSLVTLYGMKGA